jgi:hypothetical protein
MASPSLREGPISGEWADIWRQVDEQLDSIGQDFTDPKFYALKHVVEILSSNQPQAMVEEVGGVASRCCAAL